MESKKKCKQKKTEFGKKKTNKKKFRKTRNIPQIIIMLQIIGSKSPILSYFWQKDAKWLIYDAQRPALKLKCKD